MLELALTIEIQSSPVNHMMRHQETWGVSAFQADLIFYLKQINKREEKNDTDKFRNLFQFCCLGQPH